jgi:hypothetical protein
MFVAFRVPFTPYMHNSNFEFSHLFKKKYGTKTMTVLNLRSSIFALVAVTLLGHNNEFAAAFTPSSSSLVASTRAQSPFTVTRMAEEENLDGAQITSARKELKFDDKSGRFYETNIELEECIPDEEFCPIDEDTGDRIRLTLAEKERIFLDSLQVCT